MLQICVRFRVVERLRDSVPIEQLHGQFEDAVQNEGFASVRNDAEAGRRFHARQRDHSLERGARLTSQMTEDPERCVDDGGVGGVVENGVQRGDELVAVGLALQVRHELLRRETGEEPLDEAKR